ncbi:MAG: hypothetical protein MJE68_20425 [Proteobacteria bacterium]|nr:hypothetical protein [Pseudomonadota bacterium]
MPQHPGILIVHNARGNNAWLEAIDICVDNEGQNFTMATTFTGDLSGKDHHLNSILANYFRQLLSGGAWAMQQL